MPTAQTLHSPEADMTTSTETREPYERQKGESAKAFAAFAKYRDMGASTRSTAKVAAEVGKTPRLIERWCSHWHWVARADAWDSELDRQSQHAQMEAHKAMTERHVAMSKLVQSKLIERMAHSAPEEIPVSAWAPLLKAATEVERAALGEPSVVGEHRVVIVEEEREPLGFDELRRRLALRAVKEDEELGALT